MYHKLPPSKLAEQARIGQRIRQARDEKMILQKDLGEATELSVSMISRIENGMERLTVENLIKFCRFLEVSADRLLGLPENSKNS